MSKGFSIASLVLGIFSLLCCCIPYVNLAFSVLGLIFGIVSLTEAKKMPVEGAYHGMAIGGIVCAALGLAVSLIILVMLGVGSSLMDLVPADIQQYVDPDAFPSV